MYRIVQLDTDAYFNIIIEKKRTSTVSNKKLVKYITVHLQNITIPSH